MKWVAMLILFTTYSTSVITSFATSPTVWRQEGHDLTEPDKAGPYVVTPVDKDRDEKNDEIRDFLWQHWRNRRPGILTVTWVSKEGVPSKSTFVLESDDRASWIIKVTIERPNLVNTGQQRVEYRVYSVERIQAPSSERVEQSLRPNDTTTPANQYRLVLKDKEGRARTKI